jgi:hypothetical protein
MELPRFSGHMAAGVMGYEADKLRTGLVKDSPGLNVVDADCTSLR